jgi:hypothetical protein
VFLLELPMPMPLASAAVITIELARATAASMPEILIDRFKVLSPVELLLRGVSGCHACFSHPQADSAPYLPSPQKIMPKLMQSFMRS